MSRRREKDLRQIAEEVLSSRSGDLAAWPDEDVDHLIHDLQVHQIELELQNKELHASRMEIETARMEYADLYDFAPIGYLSIDQNNVIRKSNLMASSLLGVERQFLVGKRLTMYIERASQDAFYLHRKAALETGEKQTCELVMRRADDNSPFHARLESIKSVNGSLRMALIDITVAKQLEEKLKEQSAQLTTMNKELEAFAYSVAHDLRAPLRAIDGFSRMLQKSTDVKLDDEEKRRFEVIRVNAQRMGRLIDDLLILSGLGRKVMAPALVDMEALAREVWAECSADTGRNAALHIRALPPAYGDKGLLRLVLINLLANALKFSKFRKDAVIEMSGWTKEGKTMYSIRDNGIGFNMEYKDKLFGVFQRLHSDLDFEGTGVGLAVVQRIVQRHGGMVWAEGIENQGATFYFSLPKSALSVP